MHRVFGMVSTKASLDYTAEALATFFKYTPLGPQDQFYLLDNDRSINPSALKAAFPGVILVANIRPFSYAENANQVIALAARTGADAYYMNNDIIFTPNWAEPLDLDLPVVLAPTGNQNFQYKAGGFELKKEMALHDYRGHEQVFLEIVRRHCAQQRRYVTAFKTNFFVVKIPSAVYSSVGGFDTAFGVAGGEDDDYCIRTYLKGFAVMVAEHSYLLHFGGRSTWSGPETLDEWRARESHFIGVFTRKWGPVLARFLIHRDAALIQNDPYLDKVQLEAGIGGLFQELARRGGVTIPKDLLWQPRTAAVYCLYDEPRWLRHSLQSVYAACDRIFCLVNDRPWFGEAFDNSETLRQLAACPDPDRKITVIRGRWPDEASHRNAGLDLLQAERFDYGLAINGDEIYDAAQLQTMLGYVAAKRYRRAWQAQRVTYWKSGRFRIDPHEDYKPVVCVQVGGARFRQGRLSDATDVEPIPPQIAICHHLDYVRTDAEMRRKISAGRRPEAVFPGWFEKVWLTWDRDQRIENLHPAHPAAFRRAVPHDPSACPDALRKALTELG